jgi:hypothetical protein
LEQAVAPRTGAFDPPPELQVFTFHSDGIGEQAMINQGKFARLSRTAAASAFAAMFAIGCVSDPDDSGRHSSGSGGYRTQDQSSMRADTRTTSRTQAQQQQQTSQQQGGDGNSGGTAYYNADGGRSGRAESGRSQSMQMAFPTGDRRTSAILLEKQLPDQIRLNREFDYQLKVTNLTDQSINDVVVHEQNPDTFRVTSAGDLQPQQGDRGMQYNIGSLQPGESRTIAMRGTATAPGNLSSCTSVTYNPTLCTAMSVINPQVRLSKAGPERADICEEIVWTYRISNEGTGAESNVVIGRSDDGRRQPIAAHRRR